MEGQKPNADQISLNYPQMVKEVQKIVTRSETEVLSWHLSDRVNRIGWI